MCAEKESNILPGPPNEVSELNENFEKSMKDKTESCHDGEKMKSEDNMPAFQTNTGNEGEKNTGETSNIDTAGITNNDSSSEVINVESTAEGVEEGLLEEFKSLTNVEDFDQEKLFECLNGMSNKTLFDILEETRENNSYISQEIDIYEFILNEDESVKNTLESMEDNPFMIQESSIDLSYPEKCYFAYIKLEQLEKELDLKKAGFDHELQNLKFKLESLNTSIKDLKDDKEKFDKNVRFGGRHPVTKKIILQKVKKYFDDSIRTKMALTNRYMIQIQTDIMERNKFLSQIKAQEKRLASLDVTQFQETQFEHKKTCRMLAMYKSQLLKCKSKLSPLLQSWTEMKNALKKDEMEMREMKTAVSKQEHLKEIILMEKARNDQKLQELQAITHKIQSDPHRHHLPQVIEYAAAKRQNVTLKKSIKKWQKKVAVAEQAKFLHLSALQKKNQW